MKMDQKTMKAMRSMDKGGKKMKAGGPTSLDRKNMGRNMSRVKNQRGG
jgi:hypothetical protein